MMDVPPQFKDFFDDRSIHLLCVRDAAKMKFKNKDNKDLFSSIYKIYTAKEKLKPDAFEEKDIYWETMAAIGAATGSSGLANYATKNKGGNLNMCTALENLEKEAAKEATKEDIKKLVIVMRKLNQDNESITKEIQEQYQYSREEAQKFLA
jgi:hypothetical protein